MQPTQSQGQPVAGQDPQQVEQDANAFADMVAVLLSVVVAAVLAKMFLPGMPGLPRSPRVPSGGKTGANAPPVVSVDDLSVITDLWGIHVDKDLMPQLEKIVTRSAATLRHRIEDVKPIHLPPIPAVQDVTAADILSAARNRLVRVGDDLWANARASMVEGLGQGETIPELANRVRAAVPRTEPEARRVARTEVISASNGASIAQARSAGYPMTKTWQATEDGRTRPAHVIADGQTVPLDASFTVGGEQLDFPGDPRGRADNVINERCTLLYHIDFGAPVTAGAMHRPALNCCREYQVGGRFLPGRPITDEQVYELMTGWSNGYILSEDSNAQPITAADHPRVYVRDNQGEFAHVPGSGAVEAVVHAADKLKLGRKAPPGFVVRSSRKLKTDDADLAMAEVDAPDGPQVRVGLLNTESGRWDAGFTGGARKAKLREEIARKQALFDSDVVLPAGFEDDLQELKTQLEDLESERTAVLPPESMADFQRQLGGASVLANENKAKQDAVQNAYGALEEQAGNVIADFSDPGLEREIRKVRDHLGALKYRLRLVREDPRYAHYIPEAEADVADSERALEPLLAQRAASMPPDARVRLEDLERQKAALVQSDLGVITSAEVIAPSGARVIAQVWETDNDDYDWVSTRVYVLKPGETTDNAGMEAAYADFEGLKGLKKLIAGLGTGPDAPVTAGAGHPRDYIRDNVGQFAHTPGGRIASRFDLKPGESLRSVQDLGRLTDLNQTEATVLKAVTDGPDGPRVRLGILPEENASSWRGAEKGGTVILDETQLAKARQDLSALQKTGVAHAAVTAMDNQKYDDLQRREDALIGQYSTPAIEADIADAEKYYEKLRRARILHVSNAGWAEDRGQGTPADTQRVRDRMDAKLADQQAVVDQLTALRVARFPDSAVSELADIARERDDVMSRQSDIQLGKGSIPASWGTLEYSAEGTDGIGDSGWYMRVWVRPQNAGPDWDREIDGYTAVIPGDRVGDFVDSLKVDSPVTAGYSPDVDTAAHTDHNLREYWVHGKGAIKIRWGSKGDFMRCVRHLRKYSKGGVAFDPKGLCNEMHVEALGVAPGQEHTALTTALDSPVLPYGDTGCGCDGTDMPAEDFLPGELWHAVAHVEGVSTGQRVWLPGAINWREPPFALHWEYSTAAHGGQMMTVHVGMVTRVERAGDEIHAWGNLDMGSPDGLEVARKLVSGFARGISMGPGREGEGPGAIMYDLVYPAGLMPEQMQGRQPDQVVFTEYPIGELTVVSVPAQEGAYIEPSPELETMMGVSPQYEGGM